jgi:membrane protein
MLEQYLRKLPFYEKTWFQFVLFVLRRFEADRCREQAGSLTYTTLFAVVPMLTVFLVIISSIKALEPARQQLQQLIYSNFLSKQYRNCLVLMHHKHIQYKVRLLVKKTL